MLGETSHPLLHHAKRTLALPTLPPYATDLVRATIRSVQQLDASANAILAHYAGSFNPAHDPATSCRLLVDHLAMRREKRCLLAYHRVRVGKLEEAIWEGTGEGFVSGGRGNGGGERGIEEGSNLSPEEEEYVRQYGELLAAFKGQWTDVDLTGSLEPPRDLFVDVRVLKDAGEIQTEYGSINLTKNSQFYVRQGDVERLIAQGYLQKLD